MISHIIFAYLDAELKPLGGAVKNTGETDSAFWHRNAIWWSLTSHWHWSTDPVEIVDAIQQNAAKGHTEYVKAMGESYSGGYAGYIHHGNSTGTDLKLYYGGNSARIAEIKKHRDPSNLFRVDTPDSV
jgi:FAD/FMN-containing dehydrogenase